ncbi:STAS domain-containing protein [Pseudonocardia sp.]|uniref:STAS domain-containing protein n=1 Tax=Pseudonocardia sp. TaxID=60912 RepID=UPI0034585E18
MELPIEVSGDADAAEWLRPGVLMLTVEGDLDMLTAPHLAGRIRAAARLGPAHLVLDLAGVTFMGSSGIQALVAALDVTRDGPTRLHLLVPPGCRVVERPLQVTGVLGLFHTCPDVNGFLRDTGT